MADIDEPEGEEPEVVEAPEEPPVEDKAEAEAEETARKYGWVPEDEFARKSKHTGNAAGAAGWVPASRFLESPKTQVKILRDELRGRDERLAGVERTSQAAIQALRTQERQRYDAELEAVRQAQRAAVETADTAAFDAASEKERTLRPPQAEEAQSPVHPDVAAYAAKPEGSWLHDPEMVRFAAIAIETHPEIKALPPMRQTQWAERRAREVYPDRFAAPAQQTPPRTRVDGGGLAGLRSRSARSISDLPREAQDAFAMFKKEGIPITEEAYIKQYVGDQS